MIAIVARTGFRVHEHRPGFGVGLRFGEGSVAKHEQRLALGDEAKAVPAWIGAAFGAAPHRGLPVGVRAAGAERFEFFAVDALNAQSHADLRKRWPSHARPPWRVWPLTDAQLN